ncbi:MAG TPA: hypothetical protein VHB46_11960 [Burkholderiales bacterium]|nr:hypothetical protein [Burkholderiales bacterium]
MCKRKWRNPHRGASQLELVVCIALVGIFMAVFLERMFYYQEQAEKTAMEMTVANIRSGLRYKVADLIMNNRVSEIPTLADDNPVNWLQGPPENYLGEFDGLPQSDPSGKWYFDRSTRQLIYTVSNRRHFVPSNGRDFTIRYQARRVAAANAMTAETSKSRDWVSLVRQADFAWTP